MKITKKELLKVLSTMLECFVAAAIYYFVYSVNEECAHTLAVLCLCGIASLNYKRKPDFLYKNMK